MSVQHIDDGEFEAKVLKSDKPILVDFWAEWCGPCKQLGPLLDELSGEVGDKITIAKVNIDQNPESPSKYGVRGIPTMMVFKDGEVIGTKVGGMPKSKIQEWIDSLVA